MRRVRVRQIKAGNPQNESVYGLVDLGRMSIRFICDVTCLTNAYRQVQVMSTLPLKAVSRIWGRFNELEIPYYLRVPGFKLYSWIFGVK